MVGIALAVLVMWCCVLTYYDVTQLRLPNALTIGGGIGVAVFGAFAGQWQVALSGGGLLAATYLVVHLAAPTALGAGDVKLAFGLGGAAAMGGAHAWVVAAVLAPLGTAVAGVVLLVLGRRHAAIPHGPFMCAATLAGLSLRV